MKPKQLRAMVTCFGGPAGRNTAESLRLIKNQDVFVLGADAVAVSKSKVADAFETVPMAVDPQFIKTALKLVKKYKIDILYPNAADEMISLVKEKHKFSCIIPAGNVESIEIADDKGRLYPFLNKQGVMAPQSRLCSTVAELEKSLKIFGYPEKKVVIKPRKTSGCRGFHILDASWDASRAFTSEKPGNPRVRWEDIKRFLKDPLPEMVVMDFLEGPDYTCYALVQEGIPLCILPLKRSGLAPGFSLGGTIEKNLKVMAYVEKICRAFKFHGFINVQLMVHQGRPMVYEINPRLSATTIACTAAGLNMPYLLYQMFAGGKMKIPKVRWNARIERKYREVYYLPGQKSPEEIFKVS